MEEKTIFLTKEVCVTALIAFQVWPVTVTLFCKHQPKQTLNGWKTDEYEEVDH
jgi:hypothetical protein